MSKEIKFNNQPDDNTINFTLVYTIRNFGITDEKNKFSYNRLFR